MFLAPVDFPVDVLYEPSSTIDSSELIIPSTIKSNGNVENKSIQNHNFIY